MSSLTAEQLEKIEKNRKRALELKLQKNSESCKFIGENKNNISFYGQPPAKKTNNSGHSQPLPPQKILLTNPIKQGKTLYCKRQDELRFSVLCQYDPDLIRIFKLLSSKLYDPINRSWSFLFTQYDLLESKVKQLGYQFGGFDADEVVGPVPSNMLDVSTLAQTEVSTANSATRLIAVFRLLNCNRFEVVMQYDVTCIGIFKTVPSRMYNVNTRQWNFHVSDYKKLIALLQNEARHVKIEPFPPVVVSVFCTNDQPASTSSCGDNSQMIVPEADLSNVDKNLVTALMPFQRQGVDFAISRKGRVLLADDMGLGKTVQSICVASFYRNKWPLLIVCPSSVRLMWKESLVRWLPSQLSPDDVTVMLTGRDKCPSQSLVIIVSYDLLTKVKDNFVKRDFRIAIVDESHFIKNARTARAGAATSVLKSCDHVMLLSGTPALSRPCELFTQLHVIRPDLFPRFHDFGIRYCAAVKTPWGWKYDGSSNSDELRLLLTRTVMLRRTKSQLLTQLPAKLRRSVTLDVTSEKSKLKHRERQMFEDARLALQRTTALSGIEKHSRLLEYFNETARLKSAAVTSYVLDLLESDRKFVLFAHHRSLLDDIQKQLDKKKVEYVRIDGSTASDRRQTQVRTFQSNPTCKVALLSVTAANMGITLHAASLVVFAELFWNPGILIQAEDRCYRIGQRDVVDVHYLVAKGTSDDYIWQMVKDKLEVLGKAGLNGSNFDDTDHHDYTRTAHPGTPTAENTILNYFQKSSSENCSALQSVTSSLDDDDDDDILLLTALDEIEEVKPLHGADDDGSEDCSRSDNQQLAGTTSHHIALHPHGNEVRLYGNDVRPYGDDGVRHGENDVRHDENVTKSNGNQVKSDENGVKSYRNDIRHNGSNAKKDEKDRNDVKSGGNDVRSDGNNVKHDKLKLIFEHPSLDDVGNEMDEFHNPYRTKKIREQKISFTPNTEQKKWKTPFNEHSAT